MFAAMALMLSSYAAYAGWPWWVAALLGAAAAIWDLGLRGGAMQHLIDGTYEARVALVRVLIAAVAFFGGLTSAAYFLVRYLAT